MWGSLFLLIPGRKERPSSRSVHLQKLQDNLRTSEKKKCEFTESIEKKTLQEWQTLAPLFEKAGISMEWTDLKSTKEERK